MNLKRTLTGIFLFILIGEGMLRFDEYFKVFQENRVVKAITNIAITPEYTMLKENKFPLDSNCFRLMVLGDSYISGAGLETKDNFYHQIKSLLQKNNKKFNSVFVFDASVPKNNNLDNNKTYFEYVDKFKPDIIFFGYNYNDVMDNLQKKAEIKTGSIAVENTRASFQEEKSLIKKTVIFILQSKFARYLHTNLYSQFKAHGIIFPNSDFDIMMRSYSENQERWITSKELLQEWLDDTKKRNIKTIVMQCPQTDLMAYPYLFVHSDTAIRQFFTATSSVTYKNIRDYFKDDPKEYILSKYDGHSNAKAHKKIAEEVYALIQAETCTKEGFNKPE